MTRQLNLRRFPVIPLQPPIEKIYSRLGRNRHLNRISTGQKAVIDNAVNAAFGICAPQGVWTEITIVEHAPDHVVLETGDVFESADLARLLADSHKLIITAATVGPEIVRSTAGLGEQGRGVEALVYDAVGGETADAAIDWIHNYINQELKRRGEVQTRRRFSPGYGDLPLENQKIIFRLLKLEELGLKLNDSLIIIPEKSVTAIAGIIAF
jgi:hypothetical protein